MEQKIVAEKKIDELNQELAKYASQPKADDKNIVSDEQIMENQATLILLKHGNEEKEKKIDLLENKISTLQSDLNELNLKYEKMFNDNRLLSEDVELNRNENSELQLTLDREILKVAELQTKVNDFDSLQAQLAM